MLFLEAFRWHLAGRFAHASREHPGARAQGAQALETGPIASGGPGAEAMSYQERNNGLYRYKNYRK